MSARNLTKVNKTRINDKQLFKKKWWVQEILQKSIKLECGPMWWPPSWIYVAPSVECCWSNHKNLCTWQNKILLGGKSPGKCIYSAPAQEMVKYRAKFGWPQLSNAGAVTKPRHETRWNSLGCPTLIKPISAVSGPKLTISEDTWRRYCCLTSFPVVNICLSCEDTTQQHCAMVWRWRIFATCIFSEPRAAHFIPAF